jgi:hypothetical protein
VLVLQLFQDALAEVGRLNPQMTPSGSTTAYVQRVCANMIEAWSEIRERLFFIPEVSYPLVANQSVYYIGPGAADFNTNNTAPNPLYTRPVIVQTAQVKVGNARRWPLNLLTRPDWQIEQNRFISDPDGPLKLFYDDNRPISTFNVAPIPGNNTTMYASQWNPLYVFQLTDLNKDVATLGYPEAYELPLKTGLAIEMCRAYRMPVSQDLLGRFQSSIAVIENKNKLNMMSNFGFSQTLQGPTKGEPGMMPPVAPPQPGQ